MSGGKLLVAVTFVLVLSASVLATLHFVRGERARERAERRAEVMAVLKGSHSRASATAERLQEALNENGREGNRGEETGGPQLEQYLNRALPRSTIAFAQVQTASNAARKIKQNGRLKFKRGWQELGPFTLDIARLATQTFNAPTQWSGRVTALAIEPGCTASACRLYVGAAGGGVWRADDALARTPHWTPINAGIPTNSIGSLLIDPNDPSGRTLYVGTGEESGSSDSEAGLGLYKSTDGGGHWSLVPGSLAVSKDRGIGAVAVDPRNPQHIFIGTDVARHGASNVNGGRFTPPGAPLIGLYESKDGGATFTPRVIKDQDAVDPNSPNGSDFFRGGVTKIAYDPAHPSRLFFSMTSYGLFRSTNNSGSWQRIYTSQDPNNFFGIRYEFALANMPSGKTRIYLGDGRDEVANDAGVLVDASRLFRAGDAYAPAQSLTDGNLNQGWTSLSSPDKSKPGFGSFDFCEGQCSYDMWVESPTGRPNEVWLGGSMHYDELSLYAGADSSDGRAVVRSKDGGKSWTDMTGDARTAFEDQHPDTRDIAFAANRAIAFVGSDGGVIRTSGTFSDASGQCDGRNLSGDDLANCRQWLSTVPTRLIPVNAGLRTLQFESLTANPNNPLGDVIGGTQDNGTFGYTGSSTWRAIVGGDGGNSGIDIANPLLRYHTYFGPQGDVNFHGNNPGTWDWIMDPLIFSGEAASFYVPFLADPKVSGTAFVGAEHVWRTQDGGGDQSFLDNHCYTNGGPKGDALFTGQCGDWMRLGAPSLTGDTYGTTRSGNYLASTARAPSDTGTLWASTRVGRVFVTKNADATGSVSTFQDPFGFGVTLRSEDDVTFTRIDDGESAHPVTPQRFVSGISVDALDPNHAIVSYSGYSAYTPTTPGHVFDVHFDPVTGTATWRDISHNLGDQPVTNVAYDTVTGDVYAGTDYGVDRLVAGTTSWIPAAGGLPPVAVYALTLTGGKKASDRMLYAATHGRGAYRLALPRVH